MLNQINICSKYEKNLFVELELYMLMNIQKKVQ